jgi:hypothetical protein
MNTPLHIAVFMGKRRIPYEHMTLWYPLSPSELEVYDEIIKLLVNAGANIEVENQAGFTALQIAIALGHESEVHVLKSFGAVDRPERNIVWRDVVETFMKSGGIETEDVVNGIVQTSWKDADDGRVKSVIQISNMKIEEGNVRVKRIWQKKESGRWCAQYEDLEDSRWWSQHMRFSALWNLDRSMDYYTGAM